MLTEHTSQRVRSIRQRVEVGGRAYLCSGHGGQIAVFREDDARRIGTVRKVRRAWWEPYGPSEHKLGSHHRTMGLAVAALVMAMD
jgi:hypothetical protein